jgi:hemolysin-activating ACP:hemolysin acyltransferase
LFLVEAVSGKGNGSGVSTDDKVTSYDAEMLERLAGIRTHVREGFGKIAMTMMALPRYRHQSSVDLQHLVLDPLLRNRIAMAYPTESAGPNADITALAIWASVSEEVDAKICEQIKSGFFRSA